MILEIKKMALFLSRFTTLNTSCTLDNSILVKQLSIYGKAIAVTPDSFGHLNLDLKSLKSPIVLDSDIQCQLAETLKALSLSSEEKNAEHIATCPETPISELPTEEPSLPEPKATFNESKRIFDEKSLLAAFCSKLSGIWNNSEKTKCQNLPKPIAAPKRENYFLSTSMLSNEVWAIKNENKVSNIDEDPVPSPRCFGYSLPTLSEEISQSVEQTPYKFRVIDPNFTIGQDSVDSGLDSTEKGLFDSTLKAYDGELKEELQTEDENCMKFESLEDYTKMLKFLVEDICSMTKKLEDSILSTVKDDKVNVEPETQATNSLEDDSSLEIHELLEQEYEMDCLFLELPSILNCRAPEGNHEEDLFNFLEYDEPCYDNEMCLLNREEPFNLLSVPCSIWCDQKMEEHAYASNSHDMCEKSSLRRSTSLFEEHIEEMHSKYPDMITRKLETEDSTEDLPGSFLWLQDESNTAFATVVPGTEPCKKSEHPNMREDIVLNPMELFLSSLYLPVDIFPGKEFYFGKVISGNNGNGNSSQGRSSGFYSVGFAKYETESKSCAEMVNQEKDLAIDMEDMSYDRLYCNWTPLPDLTSSEQLADSRNIVDSRPSRGKRYAKALKQHTNTKFGFYRQTAMVN